jgi:hypothetical protein
MIFLLYLSIPIGIDPVETNEALVMSSFSRIRVPRLLLLVEVTGHLLH